jgi:hypothetical protein
MSKIPHYSFGSEESVPLKDLANDKNEPDDSMAYGSSTNLSSSSGLDPGTHTFSRMKRRQHEEDAAEALSVRLLAIDDDDSDEEDRIVRESFRLLGPGALGESFDEEEENDEILPPAVTSMAKTTSSSTLKRNTSVAFRNMLDGVDLMVEEKRSHAQQRVCTMITIALATVIGVAATFYFTVQFIGPPSQPVGPYALVERQEGDSFFDYYSFYEGPDSMGSNGYLQYVSKSYASMKGIINVSYEEDSLDLLHNTRRTQKQQQRQKQEFLVNGTNEEKYTEPFVYIGTAPTAAGPRDSIRLEGNRRFDRGMFM